ncbi:MAG: hypothetical protein D6698_07400 [Gammaproteobacteria bacterium]|nr:MAG: hypothetical protein D6698_07400 [Gammaproteobacteria bacterium]
MTPKSDDIRHTTKPAHALALSDKEIRVIVEGLRAGARCEHDDLSMMGDAADFIEVLWQSLEEYRKLTEHTPYVKAAQLIVTVLATLGMVLTSFLGGLIAHSYLGVVPSALFVVLVFGMWLFSVIVLVSPD